MSEADAARDEEALLAGVDVAEETRIRVRLIGFYWHAQRRHDRARRPAYRAHVEWLIRNAPMIGLHPPYWHFERDKDGAALCDELVRVWERHLQVRPDAPQLWWNASSWCHYVDNDAGLSMARRGEALSPHQLWTRRLASWENWPPGG